MISNFVVRLALGTASALVLMMNIAGEATAQSALPPVSVDAPKQRTERTQRATPAPRARGAAGARRANRNVATAPTAPVRSAETGRIENPQGPVNGYVANRTLSGTKTNTPLREIPQSISVVGAEQIRDQKPSSFDQILRYTPGVFGEQFGNDTRNDWFVLRGFRAQQDAFFLDGLSLFSSGFATWKLQPFALERVEVVRGPSSVLYGGGNPGGVINAVSKMPTGEPIRYLEVGVNSFGNGYSMFDFGDRAVMPSGSGVLDYRMVGILKGGGTQVDFARDDSYYFAPSFTYRPDADTRITVLGQASKDKTNGNNWLPYTGSVTNAPFGRIPSKLFTSEPNQDYFRRQQAMVGYQFEHDFSNALTFRQNARYSTVDVNINSYIGNGYINNNDPSTATLNRYHFLANTAANLGQIDNQLEGRFNTGAISHTVLAGFDYKGYRLDDQQAAGAGGELSVFNPAYGFFAATGTPYNNRVISQRQAGIYLQDQMKFDRLTVLLGGRQDWVDTDVINRDAVPNKFRDTQKATGRVGAIYDLGYGFSPYASYSTSFAPVIGTTGAGQLFTPEEGKQVEVGAKWEPAGFNGRIDVAWFDLRKTNALTVDPNNSFAQVQNGEVTSRGFEVSMTSNLTPEFKTVGSVSAYDLFISQDINAALLGKRPVAIPTMLASLWGDYTFLSGPLSGFGFGAGVRYVGDSFADQANTLVVPARVLFDAALHYEYKQWRAAVNVSNLTDKLFVSTCDGITSCFYGERRKATFSLAYRW